MIKRIVAKQKSPGMIAENRKARFEYHLEDFLECGIELCGTEVKSLRAGKLAFKDSFCEVEGGALWLRNVDIAPYQYGTHFNHKSDRKRKLLVHQRQLELLHRRVRERGYTIVPVRFYFKGSLVKVEVALGRGKKLYDKRDTIRKRDLEREIGREQKQTYR